MKKAYLLLILTISVLLLASCSNKNTNTNNSYQLQNKNGYYIELIYDENSQAYDLQSIHLSSITKTMKEKFNTDIVLKNKDGKEVDGLKNKVLKFRETSNLFVIYDKENNNKLIGTVYGVFDSAEDLIKQVEKNVMAQRTVYSPNQYKYIFIHNSEKPEYINHQKFSRLNNFHTFVFNKNDKSNILTNNYIVNNLADDFIILDKNNNLVLHYTMNELLYYLNNTNNKIDLDASIISKVLKVNTTNKKQTLLYFYNDKEQYAKQMVEINNFKEQVEKSFKTELQVFTIPMFNNDKKVNEMTNYFKKVFYIKDNTPSIIMFNEFTNIDANIKTEGFISNEKLQQYYRTIQPKSE